MVILRNRQDLSDFSSSINDKQLALGFVPTMGALHQGHLSLIQKSIEENQYTLASIYVNPTQFNDISDFEKYPKTEQEDIKKLESIGCDAVYIPSNQDMYPEGLEIDEFTIGTLGDYMEGHSRPGHFDGMITIVRRLFLQIKPSKAYFGEKDFQQLQIIRKFVYDEKLPIKIIGMPIFREDSGLALSSRNSRLSGSFKEEASFIYQSLLKAKKLIENCKPVSEVISEIKELYDSSIFKLDYFIIAEEENLIPVEKLESNKSYRAFITVYAGEVRLIDNIKLDFNNCI
ncbi:pantoate--beta-alanine ligase [Apibacter muscae]|uniref:pantoate--beta-alanine ligase n=1 Tax=Apibacter muscae TaxID=2509004 RepID=UPI0011AD5414|nr:pantoate--beta-alanine ligase [Apibacter muscae]TWP29580.1 pantoate--beta-alanine ligase [Apibacter muscae]